MCSHLLLLVLLELLLLLLPHASLLARYNYAMPPDGHMLGCTCSWIGCFSRSRLA
jgi:hypothetical protein